jgi:hypothetical protein
LSGLQSSVDSECAETKIQMHWHIYIIIYVITLFIWVANYE